MGSLANDYVCFMCSEFYRRNYFVQDYVTFHLHSVERWTDLSVFLGHMEEHRMNFWVAYHPVIYKTDSDLEGKNRCQEWLGFPMVLFWMFGSSLSIFEILSSVSSHLHSWKTSCCNVLQNKDPPGTFSVLKVLSLDVFRVRPFPEQGRNSLGLSWPSAAKANSYTWKRTGT